MKYFRRSQGVSLKGMSISECSISNGSSMVELNCTSQVEPVMLVDMVFRSNNNFMRGVVHSDRCNLLVTNSTFQNNTAIRVGGAIFAVVGISDDAFQDSPKMQIQPKLSHIACILHSCKGFCWLWCMCLSSSLAGGTREEVYPCVLALFLTMSQKMNLYVDEHSKKHISILTNTYQQLFLPSLTCLLFTQFMRKISLGKIYSYFKVNLIGLKLTCLHYIANLINPQANCMYPTE